VDDPEIVPAFAVMVVEPRPSPKANPELPAALLMLATAGFEDPHTTDCKVDVLPPLKVPVAVNCLTSPMPVELFAGVTAIDKSPVGVKLAGW
jgi:hypothetical protein